jgi:pyruvate carboxylase subunit B
MPGKILSVLVEEGQEVASGDGLLILEAMKMENRIVAEAPAVVRRVHVSDGQMVEGGALLIELEFQESGG